MGGIFLGIKVPKDVAKELFEILKQELLKHKNCLNIENPNNYHLTLKFYGNISKDKIDCSIIKETQKINPFKIKLKDLEQFSNKVLFVKGQDNSAFKKFKEILKPDKFAVHITVARNSCPDLNLDDLVKKLKRIESTFLCNKVCLFQNITKFGKKSYYIIREFPLGK